jgi:large subunit ribosomal protein L3
MFNAARASVARVALTAAPKQNLATRFGSSLSLWTPSRTAILPTATSVTTTRSYSQTLVVSKSKDTDNDPFTVAPAAPRYQTINNSSLSDEEIEKILAEEEAKMIQEVKDKTIDNWKPGQRKRPLQVSNSLEEFEYELEPEKHEARWTLRDKRCGALAIKVGMMPVWDEWGVRHPCTVLYLDNNVVLGHKTKEEHGYYAVQVATGQRKRKNVGKSVLGQYADLFEHTVGSSDDNSDTDNENPPYMVREFRVTEPEHLIPVHSKIHAMHFCPGQNIDVAGISKGKGFQGAMKLHGFKGMPASHGVSKSHRALGSTGSCQDPGRVFKGKKMAGRMGTNRVTVQNLRIIKIDRGRNLLFVEGAVPGNKGNFVELRDAVKKPLWRTDKVVGSIDRPPLPTFEFDDSVDGCGQGGHEVFMPLSQRDPLVPDLEDA